LPLLEKACRISLPFNKRMFCLHVIQAEFGDCLLLEFGAAANPHFILIDGGPPNNFADHLRKVLETQVVPRGGKIDLVILSHVDNDHIVGLVDLFAELQSEQANAQPGFVGIGGLWHNSFSKTIDPNGMIQPRLQALLAIAGMQSTMNATAISVNGIPEGNKLRQLSQILHIPLNANLADPITVETANAPVSFDNVRLTVVGPTQANLDALRQQWEDWLDQHEEDIGTGSVKLMANSDQSVPNLSSICVVAEGDGRRILFTGDARSDHVLSGLESKGFLNNAGTVHFDVLKLPHHGSDRNMTKTFFKKVTADQYVISANGKYGNPDLATLIWLVEAAKEQSRTPEIFLTNQTPSTGKLLTEYPPADYGYSLRFLPSDESSFEVFRV
jgi:beta-lactamase superfamily II metal-dependent hydrolase